jgi:hypothetical protein
MSAGRSISPSPERSINKSTSNFKVECQRLLQENEQLIESNEKQDKAIKSYESAINVMID